MTQEDLARRAGVSLATIRSIETGRVQKPYRISEILRALGVDADRGQAAAGTENDPVLAAIAESTDLDPEEKAHITRQYGLLRASTWARRHGYLDAGEPAARVPGEILPAEAEEFRTLVRQLLARNLSEHDAVETARVVIVTRRGEDRPDSPQLGVTAT